MTIDEFKDQINSYASAGIPFIFLIDFEMKKPVVCQLKDAEHNSLIFNVKGITNYNTTKECKEDFFFQPAPMRRENYYRRFKLVKEHILRGDTYLLNLTFPTPIETEYTLEELFCIAKAPYKLFYKNYFLVFSPECFVKIEDGHIYSYPMKGTIDASIPNAEKKIIDDKKELYEHNTIIDLIRNDLSIVSGNIKVTKYRYLEHIHTNHNELIQVSSEICGVLSDNWKSKLGNILVKLLPAGSISGAPKQKTIDIINKVEERERGYYTGIFGIFDGSNLDSAVNIRYIDQGKEGLRYHSGGGITAYSDNEFEYNEMVSKIYVPTF